ncbi:hypothetical protein G6F31_016463 [Rhizopus arrhizus]|nr:hypothetical protein G6F31_016463 [Rhizopus arrhizus]
MAGSSTRGTRGLPAAGGADRQRPPAAQAAVPGGGRIRDRAAGGAGVAGAAARPGLVGRRLERGGGHPAAVAAVCLRGRRGRCRAAGGAGGAAQPAGPVQWARPRCAQARPHRMAARVPAAAGRQAAGCSVDLRRPARRAALCRRAGQPACDQPADDHHLRVAQRATHAAAGRRAVLVPARGVRAAVPGQRGAVAGTAGRPAVGGGGAPVLPPAAGPAAAGAGGHADEPEFPAADQRGTAA